MARKKIVPLTKAEIAAQDAFLATLTFEERFDLICRAMLTPRPTPQANGRHT